LLVKRNMDLPVKRNTHHPSPGYWYYEYII
jgi:hypothetical protein